MKRISRYILITFAFAILAGCVAVKDEKAIYTDQTGVVHSTLKDAMLFARGSAVLKKDSGKLFDKLAPELKMAQGKFTVEGHTDSTGSDAVNMKLSQKRAEAVKAALVKRGIDPARIRAKGYGSTRPVVKNAKTPAEHQQNRRVVIVFMEDTRNVDL